MAGSEFCLAKQPYRQISWFSAVFPWEIHGVDRDSSALRDCVGEAAIELVLECLNVLAVAILNSRDQAAIVVRAIFGAGDAIEVRQLGIDLKSRNDRLEVGG